MPEGDTVWNTARVLERALTGDVLAGSDFRVPYLATADLTGWSVAESASTYDNEEFLRFVLPAAGEYGLRVMLPGMVYDVGATPVTSEAYGLSWNLIVVPEPSAMVSLLAAAAMGLLVRRSR